MIKGNSKIDTNGLSPPGVEARGSPPFNSASPDEPPLQPLQPSHPADESILLSENEFREMLFNLVKQRGFIADSAPYFEISPQHLGALLSGKRKPGRKLLSKLGVTLEVVYRVPVEREVER